MQLKSDLLDAGWAERQLLKQQQCGQIVRLGHGVYASPEYAQGADHRDLLNCVARRLDDESVLSHGSAAVLHGLCYPTWDLGQIHVTRDRLGGGRFGDLVHMYGCGVDAKDITCAEGWRVTSMPRTVVDCARHLPQGWGVAVADRALALGLARRDVEQVLARTPRRPGNAKARFAAAYADPRSESPGESIARSILLKAGIAAPELQAEIRHRGRFVARVDMLWRAERVVGEFDGDTKYTDYGQTPGDVVEREREREQRLLELGFHVVRWGSADLVDPTWWLASLNERLASRQHHRRRNRMR